MKAIIRQRKSNPPSEVKTRLTISDLCDRWGVSQRTIHRKVEDGLIPKPIMLGGLCWFKDRIEEFERTANQ